MKAIERVNDKCWIWKSFVEAARILKIDYHMEVVGHLRELEKAPVNVCILRLKNIIQHYTTFVCYEKMHCSKKNYQEQCV